ncbi:tRNA (5-methylaminomethyl-2-thiouridine)(34)-methyltransferase MnmD [Cyclobacterium sp.]|uniref:tRNA (5-methylaminomethyl-2-thiouridine)(34)-methyltransferase MnmD n=1 Tax=Cyclobacterium sp. TaxID=1966343 RepID=UPI0019C5A859|nr:tRNA (5-methylaminomethyl-2-thiouridine)(34)-methyltransferase MnmD [Cyclobacterium sp.]MBD3630700.1 tRNA (5-methylaminomethyl-2-thiouridine)(34)-methyltransferase MnmD [Cyclobacterium sp.]
MTDKAPKIITTEDGSHSVYLPEINESYHSSHGAYRESIHVFLLYGLEAWYARNRGKFPIRIFEVGFGTGLNAWLTLIWAEQNQVPVLYHTIEPFPLPAEIYNELNFTQMDETLTHYNGYFKRLHQMEWDSGKPLTDYFNIKKEKISLQDVKLYPSDIVYFDAFSPKKQPELWEDTLLKKIHESMNPKGVFVTYCAAGHLKKNLLTLEMELDEVPGPPGKKEMTRAWKKE